MESAKPRKQIPPRNGISQIKDLFYCDHGLEIQDALAPSPQQEVVIVEVDSASLEKVGRWPWHRDATAYLIGKTFAAGAKVGTGYGFLRTRPAHPA